jgi:uncharacterized protein (TIGR03435 family)
MVQIRRSLAADRPVIDKMGIDPDSISFGICARRSGHRADDPAVPSLFAALGDLELKLEPSKGVREFVVIDHIERPSENYCF